MKTYEIQIAQTILVSKKIKAEDLQSALDKAQDFVDCDLDVVKPAKGWKSKGFVQSECIGVIEV